jgi:hypothetical protein
VRGVIAGVVGGLVASYMASYWSPTSAHGEALVRAYEEGRKAALSTDPVSMDLEMTCVGLWASKQPVAHWEEK